MQSLICSPSDGVNWRGSQSNSRLAKDIPSVLVSRKVGGLAKVLFRLDYAANFSCSVSPASLQSRKLLALHFIEGQRIDPSSRI